MRQKRPFCGRSCAKKHSNPMKRPEVALKVSRIHKKRGNGLGPNRGGNGKITTPQLLMHEALGKGWHLEYAISLGSRCVGYPTCYKADLANPKLKITIECDGQAHETAKLIKTDLKKSIKLAELGWSTYRFWNSVILHQSSTWKSMDLPSIMQMAYSYTIVNQYKALPIRCAGLSHMTVTGLLG